MGRLLLRLSTPSIIGMLVQSLYNVVDAFFVGRGVGPKGIAAVFAAAPLQITVMAFAQLWGVGGVSFISRSLGARERDRAERTVGSIMAISVLWGVVLMTLNILLAVPLTRALNLPDDIAAMSISYIRIVALGIPLFSFSIVTNNSARAE
ncbi:MAG: MATE family efflux transporter, partial [Fretibacterium sp.]|nr:MATE family efflux transporter [Fretibacterium sp.]